MVSERLLLTTLSAAFLLAGCTGGGSSPGASTTTGGATGSVASTGDTGTTGSKGPKVPKLTSLIKKDIKVGTGNGFVKNPKPVEKGDTVWVIYSGHFTNAKGDVFDSNTDPDKDPYMFVVGQGMVIKGWDEGFIGMLPGGERELFIPSALGYGKAGSGAIPPDSDLYFDVKLLDVLKPGEEQVYDKKDLKEGSGPGAKDGQKVTFDYEVKELNGKVLDSSQTSGRPQTLVIGKSAVPVLNKALIGMKVGGERMLHVPPKIGLPPGSQGVPANSMVIITINLKKIE